MTGTTTSTPRVSVILITYNHEPYIGQALESVISQIADFPYEIIISEDASTDRTGELVEAMASHFPEKIKLLRSETNLCTNEITTRALRVAKGEFVALIDGDDLWTSAQKLQKQVTFLEANPHCSVCFHDVAVVDPEGQIVEPSLNSAWRPPEVSGYDEIACSNYIAGPSPMIRRSAIGRIPSWYEHAEFGDWPLYLIAAEHGSIGLLNEILAAYRVHPSSYWSSLDCAEKTRRILRFLRRMSQVAPRSRRPAFDRALGKVILAALVRQIRSRHWGAVTRTLAFSATQRPQVQWAFAGALLTNSLGRLRRAA